jgi:hypothetical protein
LTSRSSTEQDENEQDENMQDESKQDESMEDENNWHKKQARFQEGPFARRGDPMK